MKRFPLILCIVLFLLVVTSLSVAASPTISGVSPSSGPNTGDITITITGSGFNDDATVSLSSCNTGESIYGTVESVSENSITCTFSLSGRPPNTYNVLVNCPFTDTFGNYHPSDVASLLRGFETYAGTTPTATTVTPTTSSTPAAADGSISVSSTPSGADIYLDNDFRGKTPLTLNQVPNGNHVIKIMLDDYWDWVQDVSVLGDSTTISAKLIAKTTPTTATTAPVTTTTAVVTSGTTTAAVSPSTNSTPILPAVMTTGPAPNATVVQTTGTANTTMPVTTLPPLTKKSTFVSRTFTPIPTDTPQESPAGIGIPLMALGLAALVLSGRR